MTALRYRCLVLDHDDTAVDGSATIHHPAHVETMRRLRPDEDPIDLDGWFRHNFDPGIMAFLREVVGLDEEELALEFAVWREYTRRGTPRFYPGFSELLQRYRAAGGRLAVVSHSEAHDIRRHYRANPVAARCLPDVVFGWDDDERRRKPSPWPVRQVLDAFGLEPQEVLVVDDLKPGVLMARAAGVPVAAAGWAHQIPEIRRYMEAHCVAYFETVADLARFVGVG